MSKYLKYPTIPFRVKKGKKADQILAEMLATGFQGKSLAEAFAIWRQMLGEKKLTIWLGVTGAIVPAGMRRIIAYLIEKRFVDVIVSSGAQVFHDAAEALGVTHYRGSPLLDDKALFKEGIDRFYDVLVEEKLQRQVDQMIQAFTKTLSPGYQYSSREYLYLLGRHLAKKAVNSDSILIQAAKAGVPVFAPALCDSSIGYSFVMARREKAFRYVDQMKDTDETALIAEQAVRSGVIYLGGGIPKNFIQQTPLISAILGKKAPGHEYAIQITTDNPHFGGLSGCTFTEAQSWGKVAAQAKMVQCFCDVTIALPILAQGLCEVEDLAKKRKKPEFAWSDDGLKVNYR
ncbi:MAG: deoxyhypusine synthase [bacterium]